MTEDRTEDPALPDDPSTGRPDPSSDRPADRPAASRPVGGAGTPEARTRKPPGAPFDDEEDDGPWGDPADVRDRGPLESLGRAISAPVRESPRADPVERTEPGEPARHAADDPATRQR